MPTPPPPLSSRLGDVRSSPVRDILELTQRDEVISFAGGLPAPELFPAELIADAFARTLAPTAAARALQYSSTEGDPGLRALLAERFCARGLACEADELLVTTGSQQALGLLAAVLLDPGDVVLVESPSYLAALQSFGFAGARLVAGAVRRGGPRPRGAAGAHRRARAEVPLRRPDVPEPDRTHAAARRAARAWRRSPPSTGCGSSRTTPTASCATTASRWRRSARTPAPADRTVTISSLSKVLAPGLRIGWLRAPAAILGPLTIAKQAADLHTSTVDQLAARTSLQAADLDLHIANLCREYRRRRDALLDGLADCPAARLDVQPARRRDVRLGAAARRAGTPSSCCARRWSTTSPSCPASVLRLRARPAHAAAVVHDARARRDRRGARAAAALAGRRRGGAHEPRARRATSRSPAT